MNTPNNKRRRDSRRRMESALIRQLQTQELGSITVTEICREANVNRTTFYANYQDIYALAESVQQSLLEEVLGLWQEEEMQTYEKGFPALFRHIQENQLFYRTFFKLDPQGEFPFEGYNLAKAEEYYGSRYIEYHIAFFRAGLNAVIKKWLENDCRETPEEIASILVAEYAPKGADRHEQA